MKEERVNISGVGAQDLYNEVKNYLSSNGFKLIHDEHQDSFFNVKAHKGGVARYVVGAVRDVEVMMAGNPGNYELTLRTGAWGRDIAIPAIEATLIVDPLLGIATIPAEILLAKHFESSFWKWLRDTASRMGGGGTVVSEQFQPAPAGKVNYCPSCGAKIQDGAKFCQACGAGLA
jgi:hypothetical protein